MLIRDLFVIPKRGTIIILDSLAPELVGVKVGTKLKQGDNTWEVSGIEMMRPSPIRTIGLLLKPLTPIPERGDISVVR